ncbi:MAG: HAMP domain-containing histidine kinase [Cyanosarcina radialis HA8281-LM2]|jgi:signal transduction histidine kinase|nr:HAMP domain-containing histidine kinase [Cyanosarcina radialis HA8281-LM2]
MFQAIRYRLLFSYLIVLATILGIFAIAVRITFASSLKIEFDRRLEVLARISVGELDKGEDNLIVDGDKENNQPTEDEKDEDEKEDKKLTNNNKKQKLTVDGKDLSINSNQTVQWFDLQGHLIEQRGNKPIVWPFNPKQTFQTHTLPYPAQSITLPVRTEESNGELIGYVRVSESLEELNTTLNQLDWQLGTGIVLALALSGVGGIWLTRQAMQPIEKSFQRLQRFTADASHELRNPLMAIKSNAAVALKYPEGMRSSDAEKFQAIASATTQMTALTEDLLLLARTDKAPSPKRERVNLTEVLQELVRLYGPQADIKGIHFQAKILDRLEVFGDGVQLTRLFANSIDNALRYTPDTGTVEIETNRQESQILVKVRDTGVGIAPDCLEQIFERFWRADRSRSYGSGFGLGLAIAQNIAQNHGGAIAVTSELGAGSCFTIRLPLAPSS